MKALNIIRHAAIALDIVGGCYLLSQGSASGFMLLAAAAILIWLW
jgi:hypothetical protein